MERPLRVALQDIARLVLAVPSALAGLVLTLPLLALLAPFVVVNGLVRIVARWLSPSTVSWTELVEFDPELGWKTRPNLDTYAVDLAGDAFHLVTDENGWAGGTTLDESQIVLFGDSFAHGFGVDAEVLFSNVPGDPAIKPIGAPAYSMVQPILMMERLAERLRGKLVVLLVYLGNDLDDSLQPSAGKYRAPFAARSAEDGEWQICGEHVSREPWTVSSADLSYEALVEICKPTYRSRRVFEGCEFLIGRARDVCLGAGADLVVMTAPELSPVVQKNIARVLADPRTAAGYDPELPDREMGRICARLSVGFLPLSRNLSSADYLERDVHWNERGHRKVAAVLRDVARAGASAFVPEPRGEALEKTEGSEPTRRTG
jgi:hypothetical protein